MWNELGVSYQMTSISMLETSELQLMREAMLSLLHNDSQSDHYL